ncbi:hypothetical protein [Actinomycetospora corticicola]|uniref:Uncharacterized protein n=1 Tax=Actinomycetospora corticicola TaxID=663602 RepID=A0A7Y9DS16_9PSEU|nr:hypothetical protein [Actinomycetospora corticicola]NYD34451.1 hypothetical protein [Actinomycetospora corticicola]
MPQLLAPVTAVPQTLLGPTGLVDATGALLVGTVTGLTDTTTALTGSVGPLGLVDATGALLVGTVTGLTEKTTALTGTVATLGRSALGAPLETLTALTGPVGAGAGARALAPTLGADANRPTAAVRPDVLTGQGPAPAPGDLPSATPGSPGTAWSTTDAGVGPASRPGLPGVPAPGEPSAPAAPVGAAGASSGGGASGVAGVLPDPLAITAILAGLVLVACGRRGMWWFPEVVIGPD